MTTHHLRQILWSALAALFGHGNATLCKAQETFAMLPDVVVIGERLPVDDTGTRLWQEDDIVAANALTLDAVMAKDPAFSLYRRQSSLFGNPTSAGVSLRRTGATATSRTLVVRDGIPQNDPFGSWISWTRYDQRILESLRLIPAGSATVWGNQSAAGTVHITSKTPESTRGELHSSMGNHNTWAISATADLVSEQGAFALQTSVYTLQSDGFHVIPARQRGSVDKRLDLDVRGFDIRSIWQPAGDMTVESAFSLFEEERGNGTELSRNSTDATDASIRVSWDLEETTWQALAYYQERNFAAQFASVNAERSKESPALNQFDVPGTGIGGGLTTQWRGSDRLEVTAGADVRHLRGETNEDAGFVNGAFLRRRLAGGRETFAGAFARASVETDPGPQIEVSGRLDYWSLTNGIRIERSPSSGLLLRGDSFPERDGFEPSLGVSLSQEIGDDLTLSTSASSAFRAPTLNELYRPFRVRNDITEANPSLKPERFFSLETGAAWTPIDTLSFSNTVFAHWIEDAIANVPVTEPSKVDTLGVFVPANGSLQQRDNVDQARVLGLESRTTWSPDDLLSVTLAYQLTETRFVDSAAQPLLNDQPFPQSPEHQASLSVTSRPTERLNFSASVSYTSEAFDDALALRKLDSYWNTSLGLGVEVNDRLTLRAHVDNVLDEEVPTGLSSSGMTTVGSPRQFWISATIRW